MCQQNLSLEKASILFNMAALHSQIGTRGDRQTVAGLEEAVASFQIAAGRTTVKLTVVKKERPRHVAQPGMETVLG